MRHVRRSASQAPALEQPQVQRGAVERGGRRIPISRSSCPGGAAEPMRWRAPGRSRRAMAMRERTRAHARRARGAARVAASRRAAARIVSLEVEHERRRRPTPAPSRSSSVSKRRQGGASDQRSQYSGSAPTDLRCLSSSLPRRSWRSASTMSAPARSAAARARGLVARAMGDQQGAVTGAHAMKPPLTRNATNPNPRPV